jgi:hypothetical protein
VSFNLALESGYLSGRALTRCDTRTATIIVRTRCAIDDRPQHFRSVIQPHALSRFPLSIWRAFKTACTSAHACLCACVCVLCAHVGKRALKHSACVKNVMITHHRTAPRRATLSAIILFTNPTSPPGVTISASVPAWRADDTR